MANRIKWTLEEAIALYDIYFKADRNISIDNNTFQQLSNIMQNRAKKLNIKVDKNIVILQDFLCKLNVFTSLLLMEKMAYLMLAKYFMIHITYIKQSQINFMQS